MPNPGKPGARDIGRAQEACIERISRELTAWFKVIFRSSALRVGSQETGLNAPLCDVLARRVSASAALAEHGTSPVRWSPRSRAPRYPEASIMMPPGR